MTWESVAYHALNVVGAVGMTWAVAWACVHIGRKP